MHTADTRTHVHATTMQIRLPILFLFLPSVFLQTLLILFIVVLHPGEAATPREKIQLKSIKAARLCFTSLQHLNSGVLLRGPLMCSQCKQACRGLTNRSSLQEEWRSLSTEDVSADQISF